VAENEKRISLSPEQLIDLDVDYAVIAVDVMAGSAKNLNDLLDHPAWQRLPASKNGQATILTHYRHWADSGILGKSLIIDDVLRAIAPESIESINAQAEIELQGVGL
jgi:ABC-type Fe3+-hydroxamate transport system substrate-binding protein